MDSSAVPLATAPPPALPENDVSAPANASPATSITEGDAVLPAATARHEHVDRKRVLSDATAAELVAVEDAQPVLDDEVRLL